MVSPTYGTNSVDWESRLDLGRLRGERLDRLKAELERSDLDGSLEALSQWADRDGTDAATANPPGPEAATSPVWRILPAPESGLPIALRVEGASPAAPVLVALRGLSVPDAAATSSPPAASSGAAASTRGPSRVSFDVNPGKRRGSQSAQGKLNGGGPKVTIRTTSGTVTIRKGPGA